MKKGSCALSYIPAIVLLLTLAPTLFSYPNDFPMMLDDLIDTADVIIEGKQAGFENNRFFDLTKFQVVCTLKGSLKSPYVFIDSYSSDCPVFIFGQRAKTCLLFLTHREPPSAYKSRQLKRLTKGMPYFRKIFEGDYASRVKGKTTRFYSIFKPPSALPSFNEETKGCDGFHWLHFSDLVSYINKNRSRREPPSILKELKEISKLPANKRKKLIKVGNRSATYLQTLGKLHRAEKILTTLSRLLKIDDYDELRIKADCTWRLVNISVRQGQLIRAQVKLHELQKLHKLIENIKKPKVESDERYWGYKDANEIAQCYRAIGLAHLAAKRPQHAAKCFDTALKVLAKMSDDSLHLSILITIDYGHTLGQLGKQWDASCVLENKLRGYRHCITTWNTELYIKLYHTLIASLVREGRTSYSKRYEQEAKELLENNIRSYIGNQNKAATKVPFSKAACDLVIELAYEIASRKRFIECARQIFEWGVELLTSKFGKNEPAVADLIEEYIRFLTELAAVPRHRSWLLNQERKGHSIKELKRRVRRIRKQSKDKPYRNAWPTPLPKFCR